MDVPVNTPKIQVCDVKKSFNGKMVLDGVSLDVMQGESMVIIGLSGYRIERADEMHPWPSQGR